MDPQVQLESPVEHLQAEADAREQQAEAGVPSQSVSASIQAKRDKKMKQIVDKKIDPPYKFYKADKRAVDCPACVCIYEMDYCVDAMDECLIRRARAEMKQGPDEPIALGAFCLQANKRE
eukprot:TRINITY_DN66467_c10_g1_i7.p3 TRINITY_DN66467_c10_g1~~TRINITY_DN66467_c10_g1_i7.p3  ORF type:complete len:120 (-),score=33.48 TRINITY_DN66467_c10_g1_i7:72-431(-)